MPVPPGIPGRYDIIIREGVTFRRVFQWRDDPDADGVPGPVFDLTGYTGEASIGSDYATSLTINGPVGEITFFIDEAETAGFDFESLPWHLRLTQPAGGDVFDLLIGSAKYERV